jgi:hypothetical protein
MAKRGVKCKRVRVGAHTKTVCRSSKTGRIVKGGKMVCPKTWRGKKVRYSTKAKRCYVQGTNRKTGAKYRRFVKKVAAGSKRARK